MIIKVKYNGYITGNKLFINNGDGMDLMSRTNFINSLYFKFDKNIRDILRSITIKTGFIEISNELYEEKVVPKGISQEEFEENEEQIISGCYFQVIKEMLLWIGLI